MSGGVEAVAGDATGVLDDAFADRLKCSCGGVKLDTASEDPVCAPAYASSPSDVRIRGGYGGQSGQSAFSTGDRNSYATSQNSRRAATRPRQPRQPCEPVEPEQRCLLAVAGSARSPAFGTRPRAPAQGQVIAFPCPPPRCGLRRRGGGNAVGRRMKDRRILITGSDRAGAAAVVRRIPLPRQSGMRAETARLGSASETSAGLAHLIHDFRLGPSALEPQAGVP